MRLEITLMIQIEVGNNGPPYYRTEGMHLTRQFTTIYSRPQHVTSSQFDIQGSQVYTSSSLFTTVTVSIRSVGVGFISYVAEKNDHPIQYDLATFTLQQLLKIAVGAMLAVVVVVFLRYIRDSASFSFCFADFISSSRNCCPLNHKGTSSPSIFLIHLEVQGSICVSQWYMQCLYW